MIRTRNTTDWSRASPLTRSIAARAGSIYMVGFRLVIRSEKIRILADGRDL
jgi:hypothetical protein